MHAPVSFFNTFLAPFERFFFVAASGSFQESAQGLTIELVEELAAAASPARRGAIVEIDQDKEVVWQYFTCRGQGCNLSRGTGPLPTRALRLRNGHTLISDQYNHRVIEVNHGKQIVRTFGKLGALGYNSESVADGGLNSPYDAKRIGDYTGITPPFANDLGGR